MNSLDLIILKLNNLFKQRAINDPIEMVFLYGSWACGYPREDSDIDLAILFSKEINDQQKIYSLITEITYELTRELNREVNIISIDRSFSHPMLYYNAIVLGIPVFIRDYDKFLSLKLEAVYQMEDFQIFGIRWQQEIAQKILKEVTYA